jgi:cysteinyl-tRNA synthetase
MNITDIDDKIIKEAVSSGKTTDEIARPFEKHFFDDIKKLNIETPEKTPRATDHVESMISLIETLIDKGFAYKEADGSVYFSIKKFKDYGKLSHPDLENAKDGARVASDEYEKNEVKDFALWKAAKPQEPSWESPWGPGRPGWHIECSTMSMQYLGETLDIHTGAVDNIFPHHENEIAQSEAATGKTFSRFFMHSEHLLVGGTKMAKSAGNFYTLKDIEEKNFDPLSFRYLCLQTHYRSKMNFTWEALGGAASALDNLRKHYSLAKDAYDEGNTKKRLFGGSRRVIREISEALNDDLNTPKAMATLWTSLKGSDLLPAEKLTVMEYIENIFRLGLPEGALIMEVIPERMSDMAEERERLREMGKFSEADKIREMVENEGYEIRDDEKGFKIVKKK